MDLKVTTHALRCIDKAGGASSLSSLSQSLRGHGIIPMPHRSSELMTVMLRQPNGPARNSPLTKIDGRPWCFLFLAPGLDAYILNTREDKLFSDKGSMLKTEMLITLMERQQAGTSGAASAGEGGAGAASAAGGAASQ